MRAAFYCWLPRCWNRASLSASLTVVGVSLSGVCVSPQLTGLSVTDGVDQMVALHTSSQDDVLLCLQRGDLGANQDRVGELVGTLVDHFTRSVHAAALFVPVRPPDVLPRASEALRHRERNCSVTDVSITKAAETTNFTARTLRPPDCFCLQLVTETQSCECEIEGFHSISH